MRNFSYLIVVSFFFYVLCFPVSLRADSFVLDFSAESTVALSESLVCVSNTAFTVEYWVYSTNNAGVLYSIIHNSESANYAIRHDPYEWYKKLSDSYATLNSGVRFGSPPVEFYFTNNFENNVWRHIAVTRDSENILQLYVDGISLGTRTWIGELRLNRIGDALLGRTAEVRVWDHARSAGEIEFNRFRRLNGSEAGLRGYWPLDDGEGTTARNLVDGENGGTINGAVWIVDPDLTLVANDSVFVPATPMMLAHPATGSTRFTNTNRLQVVSFPVPPDVNQYQITMSPDPESLSADANAWTNTATPPAELTFPWPEDDENVAFYAWFSNSNESATLRCAKGTIRFTMAAPNALARSSLARETAGFTVRLLASEFDLGSDGGTTAGETIPVHRLELVDLSGAGADQTPLENFCTLASVEGEYDFALRVINAAGNETLSAPCTVSLVQTTSLPEGDRYVAIGNMNGEEPYSTWETAAADIQSAVDMAEAHDRVLVARGTYHGSGAQIVNINNSLQLIGVHPREEVILDAGRGAFGNRKGIVVTMPAAGEAETTPSVNIENLTVAGGYQAEVWGSAGFGIRLNYTAALEGTAIIRNCVIKENRCAKSSNFPDRSEGAGMYSVGSADSLFHVQIEGCLFQDNENVGRSGDGAGLYFSGGRLTLENSYFIDNNAAGMRYERANNTPSTYSSSGGGAAIKSRLPGSVVRSCHFIGNRALATGGSSFGGGLNLTSYPTMVENCIFKENSAAYGAAIGIQTSSNVNHLRNCLIYNNSAVAWGGGIGAWGVNATVEVENCTIVDNNLIRSESGGGGGIRRFSSSSISVWNSVIYGNKPNEFYDSGIAFRYCCLSIDNAGDGNIKGDPLFVDATEGNYRLGSSSPCRDAGTNQNWMVGAKDLDGRPRRDTGLGRVDMGCYEYQTVGALLLLR